MRAFSCQKKKFDQIFLVILQHKFGVFKHRLIIKLITRIDSKSRYKFNEGSYRVINLRLEDDYCNITIINHGLSRLIKFVLRFTDNPYKKFCK